MGMSLMRSFSVIEDTQEAPFKFIVPFSELTDICQETATWLGLPVELTIYERNQITNEFF